MGRLFGATPLAAGELEQCPPWVHVVMVAWLTAEQAKVRGLPVVLDVHSATH